MARPRGKKKLQPGGECPVCGKHTLYLDRAGAGETAMACMCGFRDYGKKHPRIEGSDWKRSLAAEKEKIRRELIKAGLVDESLLVKTCAYRGCKKKVKKSATYCSEHSALVNDQNIRRWQQEKKKAKAAQTAASGSAKQCPGKQKRAA